MPSLFEKDAWLNAVAQVRAKANVFNRVMEDLESTFATAVKSPELYAEYNSLISKGRVIRTTIQTVTKGIDYVYRFMDTIFNDDEINQLGFVIPFVPITVLLSITAAITYFITDAGKYFHKVSAYNRMVADGVSAKDAYKIAHDNQEKGFFEKILEPKYLIIGGGLIVFLIFSRRSII